MENVREAISGWAQEAKKHAGWLVVLGVVTVVAGFVAMASPLRRAASASRSSSGSRW